MTARRKPSCRPYGNDLRQCFVHLDCLSNDLGTEVCWGSWVGRGIMNVPRGQMKSVGGYHVIMNLTKIK